MTRIGRMTTDLFIKNKSAVICFIGVIPCSMII